MDCHHAGDPQYTSQGHGSGGNGAWSCAHLFFQVIKSIRCDEEMAMISRLLEFIRTDIWRIQLKELSRNKSFGIRLLRIIVLATRGFSEGRIHLKASALTLYSLLGIVPVFAMAFGIAKGFGLLRWILQQPKESPTRRNKKGR